MACGRFIDVDRRKGGGVTVAAQVTVLFLVVVIILLVMWIAILVFGRPDPTPVGTVAPPEPVEELQRPTAWLPEPLKTIPAGKQKVQDIHLGLKEGGAVVWGFGAVRTVAQPEALTNSPPETPEEAPKKVHRWWRK